MTKHAFKAVSSGLDVLHLALIGAVVLLITVAFYVLWSLGLLKTVGKLCLWVPDLIFRMIFYFFWDLIATLKNLFFSCFGKKWCVYSYSDIWDKVRFYWFTSGNWKEDWESKQASKRVKDQVYQSKEFDERQFRKRLLKKILEDKSISLEQKENTIKNAGLLEAYEELKREKMAQVEHDVDKLIENGSPDTMV